ncbi:MAG: redoxin family protein [Acidobacteriia bacterium]|nr:redoxin family protein [Terriglobia bacterium]
MIGKPLPEAHLVDLQGVRLENRAFRSGKVILVFVTPNCNACKTEARFLNPLVKKRNNIDFIGVISFGDKKSSLEAAQALFPFKVFYDDDFRLALKLGITRVPIKIFLEDGIMKKAWGGATTEEGSKEEFLRWLDAI